MMSNIRVAKLGVVCNQNGFRFPGKADEVNSILAVMIITTTPARVTAGRSRSWGHFGTCLKHSAPGRKRHEKSKRVKMLIEIFGVAAETNEIYFCLMPLEFVLIAITISMLLCLIRLIIGPSIVDRLLALDTLF